MSKKWSATDEKVLWDSQGRMSSAELARKFSVSPVQIKKKLLDLTNRKRKANRTASRKVKPGSGMRRKPKIEQKLSNNGRTPSRRMASSEVEGFEQAMLLFNRGVELFNARKFEKAEHLFRGIIEKSPEEKEFLDRAHIYVNLIQRQLKPAEPRPRNFEDYYNQAIYHINLGDYDKALSYLKKASEKKPHDPSITYFLALVFAGKEDRESSLKYLMEAVDLDPENRILARNESEFQPMLDDQKFWELIYPNRPRVIRAESV